MIILTVIGLGKLLGLVLGTFLLSSLVTATLYVVDKKAARNNDRRISETTLLLWCVFGGWPGGLIAGRVIRHKTAKLSYRVKFGFAVVTNLLCVAFLYHLNSS